MFIDKLKDYVLYTRKRQFPRTLQLGPSVQLYLNDHRKTEVTLTNFPNFLAPRDLVDYDYELWIHDQHGVEIARKRVPLHRFGSKSVALNELFGNDIPRWGLVAAQILARNPLARADRHLGPIGSHVFVLYRGPDMKGLGLVHQQTRLGQTARDNRKQWQSHLFFDPNECESFEAFQINPSPIICPSTLMIKRRGGETIYSRDYEIPPRGVVQTAIPSEEINGRGEEVTISIDGMSGNNAKPIVFFHYAGGAFSCLHS